MTRRIERLMRARFEREESLERVAKNLRNALRAVMDAEGGEPPKNNPDGQKAWNRAEKALAAYKVWNANN